MIDTPYTVHIVVDSEYGSRIRDLPADEPSWIIDSDVNRPVVEALWQERKQQDYLVGITIFQGAASDSQEGCFIAELESIELHHGSQSHDPPYSVLDVIGIHWTERIKEAVAKYGFESHTSTKNGFIIEKEMSQPGNTADSTTPNS
jgi:hypothetical protein